MIRKQIIGLFTAIAYLSFLAQPANACTGITLAAQDSTIVVARTIEWGGSDLNSQYVVVPRGYTSQSYTPDGINGMKFTARFGYVGLAVEQKEFIAEGLNEAGLSAGLFYFPRYGKYEPYDAAQAKQTIADLQVVAWLLGECATIDDVKNAVKNVHIVQIDPRASTVHWRFADLSGKQIVLEIIDGKLQFYDNPLGVLTNSPDFNWQMFYGAYVRTYIDRDVRELSEIGDTVKFTKFMVAAAASAGQLLNLTSLARDVGISQPTAERWLSILVASNIVYLLQPYSNNITKRAIKTPKLYFLDTGLAAYLTKWNTPDVLKNGAMAGAFFESFVVSEIIKSYYNKGILEPPIYFYRDKDMNEIDLLIEENGTLYPIEMKKHADPQKRDVQAFAVLDRIPGIQRGPGGVVCLYDKLITWQGVDKIIPINYL